MKKLGETELLKESKPSPALRQESPTKTLWEPKVLFLLSLNLATSSLPGWHVLPFLVLSSATQLLLHTPAGRQLVVAESLPLAYAPYSWFVLTTALIGVFAFFRSVGNKTICQIPGGPPPTYTGSSVLFVSTLLIQHYICTPRLLAVGLLLITRPEQIWPDVSMYWLHLLLALIPLAASLGLSVLYLNFCVSPLPNYKNIMANNSLANEVLISLVPAYMYFVFLMQDALENMGYNSIFSKIILHTVRCSPSLVVITFNLFSVVFYNRKFRSFLNYTYMLVDCLAVLLYAVFYTDEMILPTFSLLVIVISTFFMGLLKKLHGRYNYRQLKMLRLPDVVQIAETCLAEWKGNIPALSPQKAEFHQAYYYHKDIVERYATRDSSNRSQAEYLLLSAFDTMMRKVKTSSLQLLFYLHYLASINAGTLTTCKILKKLMGSNLSLQQQVLLKVVQMHIKAKFEGITQEQKFGKFSNPEFSGMECSTQNPFAELATVPSGTFVQTNLQSFQLYDYLQDIMLKQIKQVSDFYKMISQSVTQVEQMHKMAQKMHRCQKQAQIVYDLLQESAHRSTTFYMLPYAMFVHHTCNNNRLMRDIIRKYHLKRKTSQYQKLSLPFFSIKDNSVFLVASAEPQDLGLIRYAAGSCDKIISPSVAGPDGPLGRNIFEMLGPELESAHRTTVIDYLNNPDRSYVGVKKTRYCKMFESTIYKKSDVITVFSSSLNQGLHFVSCVETTEKIGYHLLISEESNTVAGMSELFAELDRILPRTLISQSVSVVCPQLKEILSNEMKSQNPPGPASLHELKLEEAKKSPRRKLLDQQVSEDRKCITIVSTSQPKYQRISRTSKTNMEASTHSSLSRQLAKQPAKLKLAEGNLLLPAGLSGSDIEEEDSPEPQESTERKLEIRIPMNFKLVVTPGLEFNIPADKVMIETLEIASVVGGKTKEEHTKKHLKAAKGSSHAKPVRVLSFSHEVFLGLAEKLMKRRLAAHTISQSKLLVVQTQKQLFPPKSELENSDTALEEQIMRQSRTTAKELASSAELCLVVDKSVQEPKIEVIDIKDAELSLNSEEFEEKGSRVGWVAEYPAGYMDGWPGVKKTTYNQENRSESIQTVKKAMNSDLDSFLPKKSALELLWKEVALLFFFYSASWLLLWVCFYMSITQVGIASTNLLRARMTMPKMLNTQLSIMNSLQALCWKWAQDKNLQPADIFYNTSNTYRKTWQLQYKESILLAKRNYLDLLKHVEGYSEQDFQTMDKTAGIAQMLVGANRNQTFTRRLNFLKIFRQGIEQLEYMRRHVNVLSFNSPIYQNMTNLMIETGIVVPVIGFVNSVTVDQGQNLLDEAAKVSTTVTAIMLVSEVFIIGYILLLFHLGRRFKKFYQVFTLLEDREIQFKKDRLEHFERSLKQKQPASATGDSLLLQFRHEGLEESLTRSAKAHLPVLPILDRNANQKRSVKKKTSIEKRWSYYFGLGTMFIIATLYAQTNISSIYVAQVLLAERRTLAEQVFFNYRAFVGLIFSTGRCFQLLYDAILIKAGAGKATPLRAQVGNLVASMASLLTAPVRLNTFFKTLESSEFSSQLTIFSTVNFPCNVPGITDPAGFTDADCEKIASGGFKKGLVSGYWAAISDLEAYTNRVTGTNSSSLPILKEKGFVEMQFIVSNLGYQLATDFQQRFEQSVSPIFTDFQNRVWKTVTDLQYWILATCLALTLAIIYRIRSIGAVIFESVICLPVLSTSESKAVRIYLQNI